MGKRREKVCLLLSLGDFSVQEGKIDLTGFVVVFTVVLVEVVLVFSGWFHSSQ